MSQETEHTPRGVENGSSRGYAPDLLTIVQHATKSELLPLTFLFLRRERIRVTFQMEERGLTHCDDPIQKEVYPEGARGL